MESGGLRSISPRIGGVLRTKTDRGDARTCAAFFYLYNVVLYFTTAGFRKTATTPFPESAKQFRRSNFRESNFANYFYSPGSANSTSKSINGSIRSSDDEIDGDNINVVIRVRPLNGKEVKNDDTQIVQFPGDGGIWVGVLLKSRLLTDFHLQALT